MVPLLRDDKVVELLTDEQQSHIVERYTDEAVRFITENKDKPFLLYLPHTAIHTPIHPGEAFRGKSDNGQVGDWIEEIDWSTGRVLDTLRELKLAENTLVIFTSDNGPWLVKGDDSGSAGPLRGGKGSTWEGGMREPTIAWWPGKIAPGTSSDAVAGTIDLLPTAVALAGGSVPDQPVIDGRDISPLLLGKTTNLAPRRPILLLSSTSSRPCARDRGNSPSPRRTKPWAAASSPTPTPRSRASTTSTRRSASKPTSPTPIPRSSPG